MATHTSEQGDVKMAEKRIFEKYIMVDEDKPMCILFLKTPEMPTSKKLVFADLSELCQYLYKMFKDDFTLLRPSVEVVGFEGNDHQQLVEDSYVISYEELYKTMVTWFSMKEVEA